MMKTTVLAAALVLVATGACAQEDPPLNCADPQTQADMNSCSYLDFERADKELNLVYKEALKSAAEADREAAEMGTAYVGAVKALRKAQRAWIDYRDGHCEGVAYEAIGGSMHPMLVSGCEARLTENRIRELRGLIEGIGD